MTKNRCTPVEAQNSDMWLYLFRRGYRQHKWCLVSVRSPPDVSGNIDEQYRHYRPANTTTAAY